MSIDEIADTLDTSPRQINRWRRDGIPLRRADELAVTIGLVPELIWGIHWDATP